MSLLSVPAEIRQLCRSEKLKTPTSGLFRPTEPIELPANTRVQITIETLPPDEQETVSFLQTARSLNLDGPSNWSTNVDKYLL